MKGKKVYLYLDKTEYDVLLNSLVQLKNTLLRQNRFADCVDELILKVTGARVKRI